MTFRDVIHLSRREPDLIRFRKRPIGRGPLVFKAQIERFPGLSPVEVLIGTSATEHTSHGEYLNITLTLSSAHPPTRVRVRLIVKVEGDVTKRRTHHKMIATGRRTLSSYVWELKRL